MSQGNSLDTTVAPADQVDTRVPDDAAALDAAATHLLTGALAVSSVADAIERHRSAREALGDACPAQDEAAIRAAGGDTSDEAMVPARAAWEAANEAEHVALDRLLAVRPTDPAELAQVMRYLAGSHVLDDIFDNREGLQNLAEMAENIAASRTIPGLSAEVVALASELCDAFFTLSLADADLNADRITDEQWLPFHEAVAGLRDKLSRAPAASVQDIAFKSLALAVGGAWETGLNDDPAKDYIDKRIGRQFEAMILAGERVNLFPQIATVFLPADGGSQGDADFLALAPTLIPMLDRYDAMWAKVTPLYEAAEKEIAALGYRLGEPRSHNLPSWMAYCSAYDPAAELSRTIDDLVLPHMDTPATTLEGLILKARVAATLDHYEDDAGNDIIRLMKDRYGITDEPAAEQPPVPVPSADPQPIGRVPCPGDAHPNAYGLRVNEDGAGMHAPPGSTVIVEPVPPEARGLAVAYMKKGGLPSIWHMGDSFEPEQLAYHPDSEVFSQIEIFDPVTGRQGYIDCRAFEKLHRVQGVYTPVEVAQAYGPAPADLPILDDTPEGCLEHLVRDAANYPILRANDVALVDITKTALTHGALCLIGWGGNGERCSILQTNYRKMGSAGLVWCVDPINRPRGPGMLERRQKRGGLLYASDGPYTPELLQPKIIGTIVGIRRSERRMALGGAA